MRRIEIFISATTADLGSCRQLMRDAVLNLGCVPILQDHFPPDAGTVLQMLRRKISGCDAVLHLAGECYGHEPRQREVGGSRRSYTQLEYDIARQLQKPLYVFVCADGFPYDAHAPESDELRRLQQLHRNALVAGDELYLPVKDPQDLALDVRELQPRLEQLTRELKKTRSWLGIGVGVAVAILMILGAGLWIQHQRGIQTDEKLTQVSSELQLYRQAVKAVADHYGRDFEASGRRFTPQEKFDRALTAVAEQQKIKVEELKTWIQVFVAQVRANPGADLYDRALADFAEHRFVEAAANATKSAEQYKAQREAAEKEAASAAARAGLAVENERHSWTLAGDSELAAGHYPAAFAPYRKAFALTDENKTPLQWCDAAQNLEVSLQRQRLLTEALPLAQKVVERRTALQGAAHIDTLISTVNLGVVIDELGNNAEAELVLRRAYEALERKVGGDHTETLRCGIDLAGSLYLQRKLEEAELVYRTTLSGLVRTLGKDHMYSLGCMLGLAGTLSNRNNFAEALPLYRDSLAGFERTLGEEHPLTLHAISNLAAALRDAGDFAEAEPLCRRAVAGRERVLGKENLETLTSTVNLATILREKGEYAEAESIYRRVLEILERKAGKDNPETLRCVNHLARGLDDRGEYAESESLFHRALEGRERSLGKENPWTLYSVINLAELLANTHRYAEAEQLDRHGLEVLERTLGPDDRETLECMAGLANVLRDKGSAAGGPLYLQALQGQERILGRLHPDTADTAYNFSLLRKKEGRGVEARLLAQEAVTSAQSKLPEGHPHRKRYEQLLQALTSPVTVR